MKKKLTTITLFVFASILFLTWFACNEESENIRVSNVEVEFTIQKMIPALKKSKNLSDANYAVITVLEVDGTPTEYVQHELSLHKIGDDIITKKIALPLGSYQISEFYLLDENDNIIYACPVEGSLMAQNVLNPLPIFFDITEEKSKSQPIEVLSTQNATAEDFGLVRFPIFEIETFQFLLSVSELGTDKILEATLNVSADDYTYSQELDSIIDNIVKIKDEYDDYIFSIVSDGYINFTDRISNVELQDYQVKPYIVEMKPQIPLHFTDDFSSDLGWANETNGDFVIQNGQVEWNADDEFVQQMYLQMPKAYKGDFVVEAKVNATSWDNNCMIQIGLADTLSGGFGWGNSSYPQGIFLRYGVLGGGTGYWPVHYINASAINSSEVDADYFDWQNSSTYVDYNLNIWYKVKLEVVDQNWRITKSDTNDNILGQMQGTFTMDLTEFNFKYIYIGNSREDDWPEGYGSLDDLYISSDVEWDGGLK